MLRVIPFGITFFVLLEAVLFLAAFGMCTKIFFW